MNQRTCAHIQLSSLLHNYQQVRRYAPQSRIMAMVKANAYGHGMLPVATALAGLVDAFGVATLSEALTLRQSGITTPIVVMVGFISADELQQMLAHNLTPVIHQAEQITCLQQTPLSVPLPIWLKIDTGMHRLGFLPPEVAPAYAQLSQIPGISSIGFMTHLGCADTPDNPHTPEQIALFNQLVTWKGAHSIAHSAAILAWPQAQRDLVRPGIMLYGISPFSDRTGAEFGLKPVMTLTARLVAVKSLKKGEWVGYGASWHCPEDLRMGIASIGYGDGYPRHAKSGTPVLVNGKRCALAGRVSMDFINIDLRNAPDAAVGDTVLVWGEGLPAEEIAQWSGTSAYELTTKVMPRAGFQFV